MILIAAIAIVSVGLLISAYLIYFYSRTCSGQECFNNYLVTCQKSTFIKEDLNTIMRYRITGKSGNACVIDVLLLQVKQGTSELATLEGKSMTCSTPYGVLIQPEENIKECHGLLKEEIQEQIIKRMHAQIVENIGKISEETTKII